MRVWTQQDAERAESLALLAARLMNPEYLDIPTAVEQAHKLMEEARRFQANLPGC